MNKYHKIQTIFKRNEKTHKVILDEYSLPELQYLKDNHWYFTEKVDGTNIRIHWDYSTKTVTFGGRTDNAQIPTFLFTKLQEEFPKEKFQILYPDLTLTLYGEGYGERIQGGGKYISGGVDFILFDVSVDEWWLERGDVEDFAEKLELDIVPIVGVGTLNDAVLMVKRGLASCFGDFIGEGLVCKPFVELKARNGNRIITKIKHRDF